MDGDNNNQDDLVEIDEDEMLDFDDNEGKKHDYFHDLSICAIFKI